jgi:LuxR family maltose regulon positive regulatory protein
MVSQLSGKRLAVIKAPAGFGKTSLAAAWSQKLQQSENAVGGLTIDPDDDEPPAFIFYLCHALQRACETVGAAAINLIRERFLLDPRAVLSTLVNDLADIDDEMYLTLEDYHWITNPEIHEALSFFLKHAPSHCHVVLTTRTEPPLPLASLGAQNRLLEIDGPAVRFDLQETRNFIEVERPGTLSPSDVQLLHEKTEGRPAALRVLRSTSIELDQDFGQYVRTFPARSGRSALISKEPGWPAARACSVHAPYRISLCFSSSTKGQSKARRNASALRKAVLGCRSALD